MSFSDKGEEEILPIPKLEMYIFSAGLVIAGATIAAITLLLSNTGC